MAETNTGLHEISVADRSRMSVSGVSGVDCFNEEMVVLATSAGTLTVSGAELKNGIDLGEFNPDETGWDAKLMFFVKE